MKYIISPNVSYSGNLVTSNRISSYFTDSKVIDINDIKNNYICNDDLIIGLHAYKIGKELINKNFNFFIIITGTDLNCDFYDSEKKKIILKVLEQAKKIIVFNQYQKMFLHELNFNSIIIPQAVVNNIEINNFNIRKFLNLDENSIVFLFVGNLRKVKDPFYLLKEMKYLYDNFNYNFVYIGTNLEAFNMNYYWIKHINGLDQISTYTAISQANGLINSSISEGMSVTILEAMKLKCPVFAKINNSNEYIINHNINGYLYVSQSDFLKVIHLKSNKIVESAYEYVNNFHNINLEKIAYKKLK